MTRFSNKKTLLWNAERPARDSIKFSIVHQEDSLEFAMKINSKEPDIVRLQVINGGSRSISITDYSTFHILVGVELDPDAEMVDAAVSKCATNIAQEDE